MRNHDRNDFVDYKSKRTIDKWEYVRRDSLNAVWYAAGGLCGALILAAVAWGMYT